MTLNYTQKNDTMSRPVSPLEGPCGNKAQKSDIRASVNYLPNIIVEEEEDFWRKVFEISALPIPHILEALAFGQKLALLSIMPFFYEEWIPVPSRNVGRLRSQVIRDWNGYRGDVFLPLEEELFCAYVNSKGSERVVWEQWEFTRVFNDSPPTESFVYKIVHENGTGRLPEIFESLKSSTYYYQEVFSDECSCGGEHLFQFSDPRFDELDACIIGTYYDD